MSQIKTLNGVQYTLPQYNDTGWGANTGNVLTQYMAAIADVTLQLTGGAFTLTADVNFGATYGVVSAYFTSRTANAASAGAVRLAKTDVVSWRNNANGADIDLSKDTSDNLKWNATKILLSGAVVNADINAAAAIAYSKLNLTGALLNADINASAAIALTKLAALTASRVPVLDASGFITASAVTATTLTYLDATSSIQTQLNGKQASGTYIANPLTGNLAAGSFKLTGLAAGSTAGDSLRYEQLFGGTVTLTDNLIFNPTTKGIKGTTTNDAAAALNVGEYIETVNTYPNNFPATTVWGDATSISLTAGDWDVTAILYVDNKGTTTTNVIFGISVTSGNSATGMVPGSNETNIGMPPGTASQEVGGCIASYRKSLSATTTVYLKIYSTYSGTTPQFGCKLSARRVR